MRKSVRVYVNQQDINNGVPNDLFSCPIHNAIKRRGLLKGKCYGVVGSGLHIGPNEKTIQNRLDNEGVNFVKSPQIKLSGKGYDFIKSYDNGDYVEPTHVTLIDEAGLYL